MNNKLIINTANNNLYLVLKKDKDIFSTCNNSKLHHNETMLPLIDSLLKENDLKITDINEFGVVIGPGSFTGIRVGIATIKAFRDSLKAEAKGINNLDLLISLATSQNKDINTVAILGSKNNYFVARIVNGIKYIYERTLSLDELKQCAKNLPIGTYEQYEDLNCFVVKLDENTIIKCYEQSEDYKLEPKYYQLSQAENEKIKKANVLVDFAKKTDLNRIAKIEKDSIGVNTLSKEEIERILNNKNYQTFVVKMDKKVVGFVICEISDEINITSIAVDKEYRNLGLATMLINKIIDYAKTINISVISLEVSKNNISAYLLYEKLGFKTRRIRKRYYADSADCLEMVLNI